MYVAIKKTFLKKLKKSVDVYGYIVYYRIIERDVNDTQANKYISVVGNAP